MHLRYTVNFGKEITKYMVMYAAYTYSIKCFASTPLCFYAVVLLRRISIFRPYLRYGYGTIDSKTVLYGRRKNTVQTVLLRLTVFLTFCRERRNPEFNSGSELRILLSHPNCFCVLFLCNKAFQLNIG